VRGFLDLIEAIVRHASFLDRLNDAEPGIAAASGAAEGLRSRIDVAQPGEAQACLATANVAAGMRSEERMAQSPMLGRRGYRICALLCCRQSATDVIEEFGQRLVDFVRRTRLLAQNIAREFRVTVSPDGSQAQFAVNLHDQAQLFQPLDIAR
jgi:hypothetical protein